MKSITQIYLIYDYNIVQRKTNVVELGSNIKLSKLLVVHHTYM